MQPSFLREEEKAKEASLSRAARDGERPPQNSLFRERERKKKDRKRDRASGFSFAYFAFSKKKSMCTISSVGRATDS